MRRERQARHQVNQNDRAPTSPLVPRPVAPSAPTQSTVLLRWSQEIRMYQVCWQFIVLWHGSKNILTAEAQGLRANWLDPVPSTG